MIALEDAAKVRERPGRVVQGEALERVEEGLALLVVVEQLHLRVLAGGERVAELLGLALVRVGALQEGRRLVGNLGKLVAGDGVPRCEREWWG